MIELAEPDSSTQEVASGVHPAALQNTHHGATHPPGRLKRLGQPSSSELRVQESADESEPSPPVDSSVVRRAVASVQGEPSPVLLQPRLPASIQLAFDGSVDCLVYMEAFLSGSQPCTCANASATGTTAV